MRRTLHWALSLSLAALAWSATPAKKKAPVSAGTQATARKSGSKTAAVRGGKKAPAKSATTWRNRQMVPSQERYREIQDALAAKGYLSAESASGTWNQASVDALKRFQLDQSIDSTGKINSLSLIALGLGPKHGAVPPEPGDTKQ